MLNVIVRDMAASLDFYRRVGIAGPGPGDGGGAHVQLKMPDGFSLELDTAESARLIAHATVMVVGSPVAVTAPRASRTGILARRRGRAPDCSSAPAARTCP